MKCLFRVDSSIHIGTGHVMRCLTLADELSRKGAEVLFLCRPFPGHLCEKIESKGYEVHRLSCEVAMEKSDDLSDVEHVRWLGVPGKMDAEQTARIIREKEIKVDWLIVDHYAIDHKWENYLRPYVRKIMVIDDLADRRHDCDLLLDQNLYQDMSLRYEGLVNPNCHTLLGPEYSLLRPSFTCMKKHLGNPSRNVRRILVFFGGVDLTNETEKALEAIASLGRKDLSVDVIVGKDNPYQAAIKKRCKEHPHFHFYCQAENMAELMANADLALGAGGTATWERCCLGLGTLIISVADNQVEISKAADQARIAKYLGTSKDVSADEIRSEMENIMNHPEWLAQMRINAQNMVDGLGTERVSGIMMGAH